QAINYARRKKIRTPVAIFTTELSLLYSTGPLWPEYFPFTAELAQTVVENHLAVFAHVEDFTLGYCRIDATVARGWRPNWVARWSDARNEPLLDRLHEFARRRELTVRVVNLAYVLNQCFPVIGIVSLPTLLADSSGEYPHATEIRLPQSELDELRPPVLG